MLLAGPELNRIQLRLRPAPRAPRRAAEIALQRDFTDLMSSAVYREINFNPDPHCHLSSM
jgi:hypothetical protein